MALARCLSVVACFVASLAVAHPPLEFTSPASAAPAMMRRELPLGAPAASDAAPPPVSVQIKESDFRGGTGSSSESKSLMRSEREEPSPILPVPPLPKPEASSVPKSLMEITGEGDTEELIEVPDGQTDEYLQAEGAANPAAQWGATRKDELQESQEEAGSQGLVEVVRGLGNRTDTQPATLPIAAPAPRESHMITAAAVTTMAPTEEHGAMMGGSATITDAVEAKSGTPPSSIGYAALRGVSVRMQGVSAPALVAEPAAGGWCLAVMGLLVAVAMLASFTKVFQGLARRTNTVLRSGVAENSKSVIIKAQ